MNTKEQIIHIVKNKSAKIIDANEHIWKYAETGFHVKQSADYLCAQLEQEGFKISRNIAGIPDAFMAEYGHGKPVIGILAEYDALAALSQVAGCASRKPIVEGGAGHGCGHSAIGAGAFGAAVAIKEYLEAEKIEGTVIFYGCPAEENGWAKAFMARDGFFDCLDFALAWHPQTRNRVVEKSTLANLSVLFKFKGIASHAAGAPENGRSALDACELMNVGVNYLREHIISSARVHYAYLDVGGAFPNIVQDSGCLHYFIRSPKAIQVLEIFERIKKVAQGAALMTETQCQVEVIAGMSDVVQNHTLNEVMYESFVEVGAPSFDENECKLAGEFFEYLPEGIKESTKENLKKEFGPEKAEVIFNKHLDMNIIPYKKPYAIEVDPISTDVGDVSYIVPTAQINVAGATFGTQLHSWNMTGQIGCSIGHKCAIKASEVLALTAIKLLDRPQVIENAKAELLTITGGKYPCPIPAGVKPKID